MRRRALVALLLLVAPVGALATYHDVGEPPTVAITWPGPHDAVRGVVRIHGTASDPEGALARVEVRIDSGAWRLADGNATWRYVWDASQVGNGDHLLEARAIDADGRISTWARHAVRVDNTLPNQPPTVNITAPADGSDVNGTVTFNGTAFDQDGWVTEVKVSIDDGFFRLVQGREAWSFTWDSTLVVNGDHTLRFRAFDGEDHSALATVQVNVVNQGGATQDANNEPPRIAIQSPSTGDIVAGIVTVEGVADDTDQGITRVQVSIDNGPWQDASGLARWSFSWDTRSLAPGEHVLEARAFDGLAYSALARVEVRVDETRADGNSPPTVVIERPEDGASVEGLVRIEGLADDLDGLATIERVEVRVPGVFDWATASGTRAWRHTWDTTTLWGGPRTIEVRAFDGIAFSEVQQREVIVVNDDLDADAGRPTPFGNEAPEVFIDIPQPGQEMTVPIEVIGLANDPNPSDRRVLVDLRFDDDEDWQRFEVSNGQPFVAKPDSDHLGPGPHMLYARVYDGKAYSLELNVSFLVTNGTAEHDTATATPGVGAWVVFLIAVAAAVARRRAIRPQ